MKQILAVGTLMVICAMLGAFWRSVQPATIISSKYNEVHRESALEPAAYQNCHKWSPMDAHQNCKPELCPTVEDETQMVCR